MPSIRVPIIWNEAYKIEYAIDKYKGKLTAINNFYNALVGIELLSSFGSPTYYPNGYNKFVFDGDLFTKIPENAYFKNIKLYLYVRENLSYLTSPTRLSLSIENDKKIYLESSTHVFKLGWNEIVFSGDKLKKVKAITSINPDINAEDFDVSFMKDITDSDGFITGRDYHTNCGLISKYLPSFDGVKGYDREGYDIESENPPYAIAEYEFFPPKPADSLSPENKTVNPRTPIRFSWNTRISQIEFELSYRLNGGPYQIITQKTSNRFYELAADSFNQSSGIVDWRIRVKDGLDVWSEYKESSFTLGVPEQAPPRLVYPTGSYVKNNEPLTFSWAFVADTIEKQSKFTLEYRINNNEWKSVNGTGEKTAYTLNDIKNFGTATGQWRVKVTNNYGEESKWSEIGKFQVYGVPPTPQIVSVSNKNLPTIKWYADQQEMFRVTVLDKEDKLIFDSGYILDYINKEYKIPKIINNGKYTFTLAIKNKYGIESEQTQLTQNIEVINAHKLEFDIFKSDYYVELVSKDLNYKVIRNNKIIGESKDGKFKDYTGANGKYYRYQIMTESKDEVNLSKEKNAKVDFNGCTLANLDDLSDFIILRYNIDNRPNRSLEFGIDVNEIEIEGSKYPFIEYGDSITDQKTYDFFIEDKDKIVDMLEKKEEFLLRDYYGDNICGVIKNIGLNKNRFGYELNFTILRTSDKYE